MQFVYNDGGRKAAGYKGETSDCVTRAIAIATGIPYQTVYDTINELAENEKCPRGNLFRKIGRSNARTGVKKTTYKAYLRSLGWVWTPTMLLGQGCKVHLRSDELPSGIIICQVSRHLVTVIDGAIHDTFDCSRGENRCVYGYWQKI